MVSMRQEEYLSVHLPLWKLGPRLQRQVKGAEHAHPFCAEKSDEHRLTSWANALSMGLTGRKYLMLGLTFIDKGFSALLWTHYPLCWLSPFPLCRHSQKYQEANARSWTQTLECHTSCEAIYSLVGTGMIQNLWQRRLSVCGLSGGRSLGLTSQML